MGVFAGGQDGSGGVAVVVGGLAEPTDNNVAADTSTHALIR